jgi:hypothetical protein
MSRLKHHLSYANVMSTAAAFIALGGSAIAVTQLPRNSVGPAQIRSSAVGTSELRNRSVELKDIAVTARSSLRGAKGDQGAAGVAFHAAVNSGGTAVRVTASAFTNQGGTGGYSINSGRDVSGCAAVATLASVANGSSVDQPSAGRITVGADGANVAVRTFDADGSVKDQPFNLLVAC